MAYQVLGLPAHRLLIVRVDGTILGPDLFAMMRAPLEYPDWEPGFGLIWDIRAVKVIDLVPADLPPFMAQTEAMRDRMGLGRSAVLARSQQDEDTVKLLNLRRRTHPERELRAFRKPAEALAWLGVPDDVLDHLH